MEKRQKGRFRLRVVGVEDQTPSLRRIVLSGEDFDNFAELHGHLTDSYVKLVFEHCGEKVQRTYTVASVNLDEREIAIDFVLHGDAGVAGPWARDARVGNVLEFVGPGGAYRPDPKADHYLFVGDESALPAISASLEVLEAGDRATVFVEVDDAEHERELSSSADVDVRYLHRAPAAAGTTTLLFDSLREWSVPEGRIQAFVHGESALLKTVRPYLLDGIVERKDFSVSAYWRLGVDEGGFREWKSQQREAVMRPTL